MDSEAQIICSCGESFDSHEELSAHCMTVHSNQSVTIALSNEGGQHVTAEPDSSQPIATESRDSHPTCKSISA